MTEERIVTDNVVCLGSHGGKVITLSVDEKEPGILVLISHRRSAPVSYNLEPRDVEIVRDMLSAYLERRAPLCPKHPEFAREGCPGCEGAERALDANLSELANDMAEKT